MGAQHGEQARPIHGVFAELGGEIGGKCRSVDAPLAIGRCGGQLLDGGEPANAFKDDEIAAFRLFLEMGDATDAADFFQGHLPARCFLGGVAWLDQANHAVAGQRIVDHGNEARLEYIERPVCPGQEQGATQGKECEHIGQFRYRGRAAHGISSLAFRPEAVSTFTKPDDQVQIQAFALS